MAKELCSSCTNAVRCNTWAEWKCVKHKTRFTNFGFPMPIVCEDYKKRDKNFKETPCQCKDCLVNENLIEELEESEEG